MSWDYEHDTTVLGGLPVIVKWSVHGEDRPATWDHPAEYQEIEFEVCDRTGKPAPWIEKKLSKEDLRAIHDELLDEVHGMRDSYLESLAEEREWDRRYA